MSDRPIGLGKVAENGTLNENGAFYSVQDINVLLEEKGGGSSGGDLPTPTVADAGSVVVVDAEGKYALGEAGGGGDTFLITLSESDGVYTADKTEAEMLSALKANKTTNIKFTYQDIVYVISDCNYEIFTEDNTDYLDTLIGVTLKVLPIPNDSSHIRIEQWFVLYSDNVWTVTPTAYTVEIGGIN